MIQVACAIIEQKGKVFAAKRGADMTNPHVWEFPGGKVETNESAEFCLKREIKEELSIEIQILQPLPVVKYQYPDFIIELFPFRCEWVAGNIFLKEHSTADWFDPKQLLNLNWSEADLPVLKHYLGLLRGN